jgi:signal transduction histidine kinase
MIYKISDNKMDAILEKSVVLIVDDKPTNIEVVAENIKSEIIDLAVALNGKNAISIAKNIKPDLILLDVMMPEMDGYEVSKILKSDEITKDIPIIFLTANTDSESIVKGFEHGAVDNISKPFNSTELIQRVRTHLKIQHFRNRINKDKENLEKLNIEKNEFLGIAAHDLKNPIFGIQMLAKLIKEDDSLTPEENQEFIQDIINSCDRMIDIITKLLDLNAIESGKIKINIEVCDINNITKDIINQYLPKAHNKNIQIIFKTQSDGIGIVDHFALIQILDNLISNALKFSPYDKIININTWDDDNKIFLEIKDEGPGMNENDLKHLFKKFSKLSARPTGGENSTGLGLSIVKRYIDAMNGNINVTSNLGQGTSFKIAFPKEDESLS